MKKRVQVAVFGTLFALCVTAAPALSHADPEPGTMLVTGEYTVSEDNSLCALKIAQAELDPEFNPEQLTYTVSVPYEVERIALTAETSSPMAKKVINGTGDLQVGENVVTVVVTAENGSTREYRITVNREAAVGGGQEQPGEQPPESILETVAPENPSAGESEPGTEPETVSTGEPQPIETRPIETIGTQGSGEGAETQKEGMLSGGKLLILVLLIFCLVLIFVIIATLLLRRGGSDEEEEYEDDDDGPEAEIEKIAADDDGAVTSAAAGADMNMAGDDAADAAADVSEDADRAAVTPEELARFYQALNVLDELAVELTEEEPEASSEKTDTEDSLEDDEDFEILLEDDEDFDFLDF